MYVEIPMLIDSSIAFINVVKTGDNLNYMKISNLLCKKELADASLELIDDKDKIIFWSNIYNAFFQILAKEKIDDFSQNRSNFFNIKQVCVFGLELSFNDIEHRILRRSKWRFGLGYISNIITAKWERQLRVESSDYRVHFVLNCGAEGCPIIRPLDTDNYETELFLATKDYLEREVRICDEKKLVHLNQLFLFYLKDFGGKKGLLKLLERYNILTENQAVYPWKYTPFDRTMKLDNYAH